MTPAELWAAMQRSAMGRGWVADTSAGMVDYFLTQFDCHGHRGRLGIAMRWITADAREIAETMESRHA